MQQVGKAALVVGLVSLVVGVISRLTMTPILGIEAQAFLQFTQACFLLTIATSLSSSPRS